ncbi:MAG: multicopper oxidase domain-containing protein [Nitrospirota bacterium]
MLRQKIRNDMGLGLLVMVLLLIMTGAASAAEYWLKAGPFDKTMPDGAVVRMWGFAQCLDNTFTNCSTPTVPGPALTAQEGDTLTIHVMNNLGSIPGSLVEPVSIIIPGQSAALSPKKFFDDKGRERVKSFTTETPADNATVVDYTWQNVKAGTYLYQSGTHPAVQVQMGLYGALKVYPATAGQVYSGIAYDREVTLLYSEIDPALHTAVATDNYGPGKAMTSTMYYEPKYFLINGEPHSSASTTIAAGKRGERILIRFLNAGLESHNPVIDRNYMKIIAEDGNAYDNAKEQYALLLPAGKTIDAIITPATHGIYAVYDRMLALTNGANAPGGMLAHLDIDPVGADKIGTFRSGKWYLDNGNGVWNPGADLVYTFGLSTDKPVSGDWNGDGKTEIGTFRSGKWYLDNGNGVWYAGIDMVYTFGMAGDVPVTGDWDGGGSTKIGVFRSGKWYLDNGNGVWNAGMDMVYTFGMAGDIPVTGDWDGDGKTEIGVFRNGTWYLDSNGNGVWNAGADAVRTFGLATDIPITGDWNGDGTTDIGVFRNGTWYLDSNGNGILDACGTDGCYNFGISTDIPVTGKW